MVNDKIGDSLISFFTKYDLTNSQNKAIDLLNKFIVSKEDVFILNGYAGTGKTFLLKGLCDYFTLNDITFSLMAPTGRATKVMKEKTKHNASTIHKGIYSFDELKSIETQNDDGEVIIKYYYDIKINDEKFTDIYIIDEASMLSNIYNEQEFFKFGSGYLLDDLLKYIDINKKNSKVIFIGDNVQLPPVGANFSFALSGEYLKEHYNVNFMNYEMVDIVRQNKYSGILANATRIRGQIKDKNYSQLVIDTSYKDLVSVKTPDIMKEYINVVKNITDSSTIMITYSNAKANLYNKVIREHFFKNRVNISVGDQIMIVQNNYTHEIELFNGDFGIIESVSEKLEERIIPLKKDKRTIDVKLTFRDSVIKVCDINGIYHLIECKTFENLLISKERDITPDEMRALYVDFIIRNKGIKKNTAEFRMLLNKDPYFNCLKIKYGYAVTCHKSQGGEWKNVFIDFDLKQGLLNENSFRWIYTAVTRAKEKLFTINEPDITILQSIQNEISAIGNVSVPAITINESEEIDKAAVQFGFSKENTLVKTIFMKVFELINVTKLKINKIQHMQYTEKYTFISEGKIFWVQFFYNKSNKITKIKPQPNIENEVNIYVLSIFDQLLNKELVLNTDNNSKPNSLNVDFTDGNDNLKCFYGKILEKIKLENIEILEVRHLQYMEAYKFGTGNFSCCIDFYYNGKGQFTSVNPRPQNSNSEYLLNKILVLLKE